MSIQELAFQDCEETLAQGVVVAVADRSHRRSDGGLSAAFAKGERRVLAPLVGMVNHVDWTALIGRHRQGIKHQLSTQVGRHYVLRPWC